MNNKIKLSLIGGALLTGSAFAGEVAQCQASAPSFESDLTVGYDSQYIFRGTNVGNDLVSAAINTAWTCDYTGLDMNAGVWYGSVTGTGAGDFDYDELDLTIGASKDLGFARANVGFIHYDFIDFGGAYAQEVYFGLSKDLCHGVSANLTYFWDVNGGDLANDGDNDGYTELALTKSCDKLGKQLDLAVSLGYLAEKSEFSHLTAKLSHDVEISENATLTPYIAHSWELSDEADYGTKSSAAGQENEFFAGAALSVSF